MADSYIFILLFNDLNILITFIANEVYRYLRTQNLFFLQTIIQEYTEKNFYKIEIPHLQKSL